METSLELAREALYALYNVLEHRNRRCHGHPDESLLLRAEASSTAQCHVLRLLQPSDELVALQPIFPCVEPRVEGALELVTGHPHVVDRLREVVAASLVLLPPLLDVLEVAAQASNAGGVDE